MTSGARKDIIKDVMDSKLTLGQVVSGAFVMTTTIVGLVTYVHVTFQTKVASEAEFLKIERRIEKSEDLAAQQIKDNSEIKSNIAYVRGVLEAQLREKKDSK